MILRQAPIGAGRLSQLSGDTPRHDRVQSRGLALAISAAGASADDTGRRHLLGGAWRALTTAQIQAPQLRRCRGHVVGTGLSGPGEASVSGRDGSAERHRHVDDHVLLASDISFLADALEDLVQGNSVACRGSLSVEQKA